MNKRRLSLWAPNKLADSFFDDFFGNSMMPVFSDVTEVEMFEEGSDIVVRFKAPGFTKDDLDIDVEDNVLTVSAEAKQEDKQEDEKKKYYYKEIRHESFSRSVSLPTRVKTEESNAEYKDGILTIRLPKSSEEKSKKISISY